MSLNKKIINAVELERDNIFNFLKNIVNINSFTSNFNGIEKVCKIITDISSYFGINFEKYFPNENSKRFHLIYNKRLKKNFYGIIGHIDTVHSPEDNFQSLYRENSKLIGPGVNDMKGGIVAALYSIFILSTLNKRQLPIKIIFNTDEEVGSKTSKDLIVSEMKNAKAVFVFEAGRLPGNKIISNRKGAMELKIMCYGKSSHAGESPDSGINSIVELCDKITELFKLNNIISELSLQPGVITGGTARNVIPEKSEATIDIRFGKKSDKETIENLIKEKLSKKIFPQSKIEFNLNAHRMPMEKSKSSEKFIQKYIEIGKKLGYNITTTDSGGVSDANLLSEYCPVLDGLGPLGEFCHTKKEYIIAESLIDRIKIFTCFLSGLTN